MENVILNEALRLAKIIYQSFLPDEQWLIVNIALHKKDTFLIQGYPDIPTVFGYRFDKTTLLLEKHGVIEGKTPGLLYVRITVTDSYYGRYILPEATIIDDIGWIAREKGYINHDQLVEYYNDGNSFGPRMHGQAAILVSRRALELFIKQQGDKFPITSQQNQDYWYTDKQLKFRLSNGRVDQLDFSRAEFSRKFFETFWELWSADGKGEYTPKQIVDMYKRIFKGESLREGKIGEMVSNIRSKIIAPKTLLSSRIKWSFDRQEKLWIFRIFPLTVQS